MPNNELTLLIMKKLSFYLIRDNEKFSRSWHSDSSQDSTFYSPSLDSAIDMATNMLLNGSNSVTIECLGEHELKF